MIASQHELNRRDEGSTSHKQGSAQRAQGKQTAASAPRVPLPPGLGGSRESAAVPSPATAVAHPHAVAHPAAVTHPHAVAHPVAVAQPVAPIGALSEGMASWRTTRGLIAILLGLTGILTLVSATLGVLLWLHWSPSTAASPPPMIDHDVVPPVQTSPTGASSTTSNPSPRGGFSTIQQSSVSTRSTVQQSPVAPRFTAVSVGSAKGRANQQP
ncbi:MAG: hypothetical protein N2C14_34055, partial [Planctomycetales bacterium]